MPVDDYDRGSCFGRDEIVDAIISLVFSDRPQYRGLLIEGPANRGKSWVVCRTRDKLTDPAELSAIIPDAPPVAVCLFTHRSGYRNGRSFDPLWLMAEVWWALYAYLPNLFWPKNLPADAAKDQAIVALYDLFVRDRREATDLIALVDEELGKALSPVCLAVLVDGLDEFDDLKIFERQFLEPLARSPAVIVIASRRSQVRGASWVTFLLRTITRDTPFDIARLDLNAAIKQIDTYFSAHNSSLKFTNLQPLFKYYVWQNPGANKHFSDNAINNRKATNPHLISTADIHKCILVLSTSGRYPSPISTQDFDWLIAVVRGFPQIGVTEVLIHKLNPVLSQAAGRNVSDKERNEWLGRLQERGIVVLRKSGQCLIHEEFAALCQE